MDLTTPTDLYVWVSVTGGTALFAGVVVEHAEKKRAVMVMKNNFIWILRPSPILVRDKMIDNVSRIQDDCSVMKTLRDHVEAELKHASESCNAGDLAAAFRHLERAHVLGQASTYDHTRIHWQMFKLGLRTLSLSEIWGQFIRIIGAATKTPLGIYPTGNTGGANVWFFKPMPVEKDLAEILDSAK